MVAVVVAKMAAVGAVGVAVASSEAAAMEMVLGLAEMVARVVELGVSELRGEVTCEVLVLEPLLIAPVSSAQRPALRRVCALRWRTRTRAELALARALLSSWRHSNRHGGPRA